MKNVKADRRAERTRKLLRDALIELMLEKRYDRITVQDIIDRANVGRSTFYMHYQDKQDLFLNGFERLFALLTRHTKPENESDNPILPSLDLFRHVQSQHRLYEALVWGKSVDLIFMAGQQYLNKNIEERLSSSLPGRCAPSVPLPVVSNYMAGALLTLLKWWLDNKMPYSPEEMDKMFQRLVMPGVSSALEATTK